MIEIVILLHQSSPAISVDVPLVLRYFFLSQFDEALNAQIRPLSPLFYLNGF